MKKILCSLLIFSILLSGCGAAPEEPEKKQYTATFLDLFDTVTTIVGFAESEEDFKAMTQKVHDDLLLYHQLFDIYYDYEGINNLKTINDRAGKEPVKVAPEILELLLDCKEYDQLTNHKVNVAMGSVLALWHEERNAGINDPVHAKLPDKEALEEAAKHMDLDAVEIDEEKSTVYISDPNVRLDVGAIAKGWSTQKVAEKAPEGLLLSVGGNVCSTGSKGSEGTPWVIGIENYKKGKDYLHTVYLTKGCVVTSGDYQRTYTVNGEDYHHIIDPDTLYPAKNWHMVTILCKDSGIADMLSTALFLMPQEDGLELLEEFDAEAMWVGLDDEIYYSPGFKDLIRT